jgi:DNA-binding transcriptional ArsR family regulator
MSLHRNEREIIRTVYGQGRPVSIHEVARISGMSWITAKKYLRSVEKKGIIKTIESGRSRLYDIDPLVLEALWGRYS